MKRSGKFYYRNERETMESLGLEQTPGSGNGWVCKEDGQSENVICQLKSTDASSIKVNLYDLQTLEYNANISHKLPVFAIQFLGTSDIYLLIKPEDLPEAADYIKTGSYKGRSEFLGIDITDTASDDDIRVHNDHNKGTIGDISTRMIKSSKLDRDRITREREAKYKKKEKSAT